MQEHWYSSQCTKWSQLCINTSIVYMHRFYMFHSFKQYHRNTMAPCFIFLGAKVEEQPRKLEHVLKVAHRCLHKDSDAQLDVHSDEYMQLVQDLIDNESVLLQTLGFHLSVEHPHTYVVKCAQMVKAAKELAQTSYFLATNSLHLTTFCIEEKPTVVACVCIYVACKWTNYEIPETNDKKNWWEYMDSNTTLEKIEEMSSYFIKILDSSPTRLKKKISTGPVIYKGGTIQPKREADGEHSKSDKAVDSNANKTSDKIDGSSSRSGGQGSDKHLEVHSKRQDNQLDVKRGSNESSQSFKKHVKHHGQGEHDRKNAEHHKHHKRKHSDHGKHQGDRTRSQEPSIKRPDGARHERTGVPESKTPSLSSRPSDGLNKPKVSQSDELSSAAKHILSLPPLHHKHSLPDADKSATSESPAKKPKVDANPPKKLKPDNDAGKMAAAADPVINTANSSSHKKSKSSSDKHKMRLSGDKHAELFKHLQQTSEKSSHGQKHHSNVHDKHSKEKKLEQYKTSSSRGSDGIEKHPSKSKVENTSSPFKSNEEVGKPGNEPSLLNQVSKQPVMQKKTSSSEKKLHKTSNSTPKKNGHSRKAVSKVDSLSKETSLPPPPPPPAFSVPSILTAQPPLPTEPEVKQAPAPAPPGSFNDGNTSMPQKYVIGQAQGAVMQAQMQGQVFSLQHQVIQNPSLVSQSYQQPQFLTGAQPTVSTSNAFNTTQLYYQGQQESQGGSSDVSQAYWQSMNTSNLFSPSTIGLLPQPPVPPQGLVIHQVDGLPPPPPLNFSPFPPPPT